MGRAKLSTSLVAALAIAIASALYLQRAKLEVLQETVTLARHESADRDGVVAEHRRLQKQLASIDTIALRRAHEGLVARQKQIDASSPRPLPARPAAPIEAEGEVRSAASWSNVGFATPGATVETLLFGATKGDLALMARGLVLEADTRAAIDAIWASLAEPLRTQYQSAEQLTALFVARSALDVAAMQVLSKSSTDERTSKLLVRLRNDRGDEKDNFFDFRRGGAGWQLVVPPRLVDHMKSSLSRPIGPTAAEQ